MRGKLTPEQQARQREGARRWQASRDPEERAAANKKGYITRRKKSAGQHKPPGRLSAPQHYIEGDEFPFDPDWELS